MTKRLTEKQKGEIIKSFTKGKTIEALAQQFDCTKLTITRNIKKDIGESRYHELINKNKNSIEKNIKNNYETIKNSNLDPYKMEFKNINDSNAISNESDYFSESSFLEIKPLDYQIENLTRKELSSIPISDVDLPKIVYMIVDNKIELEIKLLKDYPEWNFLPLEDLNRKTIEIYHDLKIAKRFCNKEQKVIKVPNTDVFRITAPLLTSRGISRIVSAEKLIAL